MTPEQLEEIRRTELTFPSSRVQELLAYVDELTRQLDDARDKAINAGIFTSTDGGESKYTHALNTDTCEDCGDVLATGGYCYRCDTEISTPGATSFKPPAP